MRITWVTRSFLDYRIPIYKEINRLCGNNLYLIYNEEIVPEHLTQIMKNELGERCIPLKGEIRLVGKKKNPVSFSNAKNIRIPIQKGLINTIKNTNPDIIITDGFFQWTYAPLVIKLFNKKVKHVMCYEGWQHTERNMQFFRIWYRKLAMKLIDSICCNGILSKKYVESLGYPSEKISLGNMAADTSFFSKKSSEITQCDIDSFRKRMNLKGTVYCFSGRLVQLKGIKELVVAWKNFSINKNVTLFIIGDGPLKEELESYINDNNLSNIIFAGFVNYVDLPIYYKASDIFIIPTLQDNWSLVVPEAMACELPIMSSIYNGCYPELVTKENGWIFDPLDKANMESTLSNSYKNINKEMGIKSKEIVLNFTPQIIAGNIFKTLLKLISI